MLFLASWNRKRPSSVDLDKPRCLPKRWLREMKGDRQPERKRRDVLENNKKGKRRGDGGRRLPSHHNSSSHVGSYLPIPWRHQLFAAFLHREREKKKKRWKKQILKKKGMEIRSVSWHIRIHFTTQNGEHVLSEARGCWSYTYWNTQPPRSTSAATVKLHRMHWMAFKGVLHILSVPICRKIDHEHDEHGAEIFERAVAPRKGCDILFSQRWRLLVKW